MAVEEAHGVHLGRPILPEVRQGISPSRFFQDPSVSDITATAVSMWPPEEKVQVDGDSIRNLLIGCHWQRTTLSMGNTPRTQIGPLVVTTAVVPVWVPMKQRSSFPEFLGIWNDGWFEPGSFPAAPCG